MKGLSVKSVMTLIALLFSIYSGESKVRLSPLFSDNMLLQQRSDILLRGNADGRKVKVEASWLQKSVVCEVHSGEFCISIPTPEASFSKHSIVISDCDSKIQLEDILIGEVWICSGQSNMDMPVRGYSQQPVQGALEISLEAPKYSNRIRFLQIPHNISYTPTKSFESKWQIPTTESVLKCSATAYLFAKSLSDAINVPIGIVVAARGSSHIEAWMPEEVLSSEFGYDVAAINSNPEVREFAKCGTLLNGMLHPIVELPARGFLWYQGESNISKAETYDKLMEAMVRSWRNMWGDANLSMPFIYMQIAPYKYNDPEADSLPKLVEAQQRALSLIPNSAIVTTTDLGELNCIHPSRKSEVGRRAAVEAMRLCYDIDIPDAAALRVESCEFLDKSVIIRLHNAKFGLSPRDEAIVGFELAGEDGVFFPAVAKTTKNRGEVELHCDRVTTPHYLRYAYKNYPECNLRNNLGYPALPFMIERQNP